MFQSLLLFSTKLEILEKKSNKNLKKKTQQKVRVKENAVYLNLFAICP